MSAGMNSTPWKSAPAELLALLHVAERVFSALGDAQRLGGDDDPGVVQGWPARS